MKYFLISFNHKNSNVTIREKFAFSQEKTKQLITMLLNDNIQEVIYLSTCNRVEIICYVEDEKLAKEYIFNIFHDYGITDVDFDKADVFINHDAIKHIFEVISSIDSIVVGETQISGQMKKAFTFSAENNFCSKHLSRAMHKAFKVSALVRSQTNISQKPISIASVAVEKAKEMHGGSLGGMTAIVIGSGEISRLVAKNLARSEVNVIVFNRTLQKAKDLASELGSTASYKDFCELKNYINKYRLLFSATSAISPIIDNEIFNEVDFKRYWFDLAIPRDILSTLEDKNLNIIVVDDLKSVASKNQQLRAKESVIAKRLISEQADKFFESIKILSVEPLIKEIREHARLSAQKELTRAVKKGFIPARFENDVERFLHSVFNEFLHTCTKNLKELSTTTQADTVVTSMRQVMGFDHKQDDEIPNINQCPHHFKENS